MLVGLWTLGLLAGAVHPLGYLAAVAWLGVSTWFLVALGTLLSLRSRDAKQATRRVLAPVSLSLLVFSSILLVVLPRGGRSVLLGAGSVPFLTDLSLVTYEEVRVALHSGAFPRLGAMRLGTGEGATRVLATCLLGITGQAVAAFLLARSAILGFDAAVGRLMRPHGDGRALCVGSQQSHPRPVPRRCPVLDSSGATESTSRSPALLLIPHESQRPSGRPGRNPRAAQRPPEPGPSAPVATANRARWIAPLPSTRTIA